MLKSTCYIIYIIFFEKESQNDWPEKMLANSGCPAYKAFRSMAEVAQLVEHLVVAQVAVGSSPIFRPITCLPESVEARKALWTLCF